VGVLSQTLKVKGDQSNGMEKIVYQSRKTKNFMQA